MSLTNHLGQPVGAPVPGWKPARRPSPETRAGRWCRLEPLDVDRHAEELYRANAEDASGRMWTYLPYGPFADPDTYRSWLQSAQGQEDPLFFAIVREEDGRAVGLAAFLRVNPPDGTIEVGHLAFSPSLQGTTAATEAMALMMAMVFDELGYRRYEWKCNALNEPSRRAAARFGFVYEGAFAQAAVIKGRNRDTAWFSILDAEWPALKAAYDRWLDPANFTADGRQVAPLSELTAAAMWEGGDRAAPPAGVSRRPRP